MSYRQEQLWILDKVTRDVTDYTLVFSFSITGALDREALEKASNDVIRRHTALRTVLPHEHATGTAVVRETDPVALPAETAAREDVIGEERRRGMDLDAGPLARFRLLRTGEHEHELLLFTHYAVVDRRSAGVLAADLAVAYGARLAGEEPQWPVPAQSSGEYATRQREWVATPAADGAREWWQQELASWELTELPADLHRGKLLSLAAGTVRRPLDPEVHARAAALGERAGGTADDVLLAAFVALLHRLTGQDDLIVGLPGDVLDGFDPAALVADAGNLVPLRAAVPAHASFADLTAAVLERRAAAAAHQALPFKEILAAADVSPDPARLPLVQLGFDVPASYPALDLAGGARLTTTQVDTGTGAFELALEVIAGDDGVELCARYATALYRPDTVAVLLDRYLGLLDAATRAPGSAISALPVTFDDERRRILHDWNATEQPREPRTLPQAFAEVVRRDPGAVALTGRFGEISYGDLDAAADAVAVRLAAENVPPGSFVPVAVHRNPHLIEAILGVLKAGCAYVPIDLGNPGLRMESILADCAARVVLTDDPAALPAGPWTAVDVTGVEATGQIPDVPDDPAALAYAIYTSGSTGTPKGVMVEHRNVTNFIATVQEMFRLTPADRFLQFASPGFDVSVFEIFASLLTGARLYIADEDERRSTDALDAILADREITVIDLPPAIMDLLDPGRYPKLRVAFVGGEAFGGELTTRWADGREFYNGYGPTETTVTVVAKRCTGVWPNTPPIGRAMTNHRAYSLDGDLQLLPPGAVGELAVAGAGLGRGYLNRPDLTAERFRPDPYGPPGSRLYLTGDLAVWDGEGDLTFRGRSDRQVKVRGVRIELGDVEAALTVAPEVGQAVADVVPDPRGGSLLVAYLVPADGATMQLDAVRAGLHDRLPATMIPSFLIPLDAVPLTASGKVNRKALPPVRFAAVEETDDLPDEDRTPIERKVAEEVFVPLLGTTRIGNHDNFFALGGTSLQAIRVASRVRAVFGVDLPVADFFQDPTVAGTAAVIEDLIARRDNRREDLLFALSVVESRSDEEIDRLLADDAGAAGNDQDDRGSA